MEIAHVEIPTSSSLFRTKRQLETEFQEPASIFWPEDLLRVDHTDIRILTYGYDSNVTHYFKGPTHKLNLSQHGEALLNRVAGERQRSNCAGRHIIFVAHSLGGLLVKEALVEARKQVNDSSKLDLYNSTQGIIFFGTPHRGSNDAQWGLLLSTIVSAAFDTNKTILHTLDPDGEIGQVGDLRRTSVWTPRTRTVRRRCRGRHGTGTRRWSSCYVI
jgi:hypothetical protein